MIRLGLIAVFACSLIFSCAREMNTLDPSSPDFRYPLYNGAEWRYSRIISKLDDSNQLPPEVQKYNIAVQVIGEETIFDARAIKVREVVESLNLTFISYTFYENSDEALYLLGSLGENVVLPKRQAASTSLQFPDGLLFSHPFSDSIHQEIPPKVVLKYPLTKGSRWQYREKGKPRRIDKIVGDKEKIKTPAGEFETGRVQWLMDFDGDGEFDDNVEFFDYIANTGLVKRTFRIKNLPLVDDEGHNIGSYTYLDESLLTEYSITQ